MPKNTIFEFDRTSTVQEVDVSNTVFVPIHTSVAISPTLCKTVTELETTFEEHLVNSDTLEYSPKLGFNLCKHLIVNGLTVLVQGVTSIGDTKIGTPTLNINAETKVLTITPAAESAPDTYHISFVGWDEEDGVVYPEQKITIYSATLDLDEHINKKGTYIITVTAAQNGFANSDPEKITHEVASNVSTADIDAAITANRGATRLPMESVPAVIDWAQLEDKNLYDIRFLTTGALKIGLDQAMITCAKNRGDCTALVSFNEADGAFTYNVADIKDIVEVIGDGGEYAAAFTPAFYSKHSSFSDGKVEVLIPSAFAYLFAYARSVKNNPEWFAIAGFERGIVPELSRLKHYYTSAEINELQNRTFEEGEEAADNVGIAINAIGYIRPAGDIIYGNRTLKNNEAEKGLTATSFLNVRNMISTIKKVAYEAANRFTFEQNSETLWVNYKSYIEPTLDRITHSNGAVGYSINRVKLENSKAKMKAEIVIQPIEAVEDIELSIIMTDTNTVVNE